MLEEKAAQKIKQLKEAVALMEELSWRVVWALDFSNFQTINEELDPVQDVIAEAHNALEEELESLEEATEDYKTTKEFAEAEFDQESNLQYYLE
tara:strand:+ start:1411 stop:1692 length:282 start_codon:yes stop_codon:yes gene_type:complete